MSEGRRNSKWMIGILVVGVLAAVLVASIFLTPLGMFVFIPLQMNKIKKVENQMQQPAIYQEVATNLALYCQSVDLLQITNDLGASRLPQPLPQLGSPWSMISSNNAHVEFGGGFYHYGYGLQLDESASDSLTNVWELRFATDNQNKLLLRFTLPANARYSRAAFLKNSLAEYDARITKSPQDVGLYKAKINLLSQYNRSQMRSACLEAVKAMPDHWWPRLTLALLDSGAGNFSAASNNFVSYVEAKPSYSRYLYLAYFFQLTSKPDEAAKAVEKAVTLPIADLADDDNNTEARGYSAGVYLYENGKYAAVIKLCDALLPVKINGNYAKNALQDLKMSAQASLAGGHPTFMPSGDVLGFDAYQDFDIRSIVSP